MHLVFTMPESLARLALANTRVVYDLLFRATAATLLQVVANRNAWCAASTTSAGRQLIVVAHLGAAIGGLVVLHTWGQPLQHSAVGRNIKCRNKNALFRNQSI